MNVFQIVAQNLHGKAAGHGRRPDAHFKAHFQGLDDLLRGGAVVQGLLDVPFQAGFATVDQRNPDRNQFLVLFGQMPVFEGFLFQFDNRAVNRGFFIKILVGFPPVRLNFLNLQGRPVRLGHGGVIRHRSFFHNRIPMLGAISTIYTTASRYSPFRR